MDDVTRENTELLEDTATRKAVFEFLSAAYLNEMSFEFLEGLRDSRIELEGELGSFVDSLARADLEDCGWTSRRNTRGYSWG